VSDENDRDITKVMTAVNGTIGKLSRELAKTSAAALGPTPPVDVRAHSQGYSEVRFRLSIDVLPGWVNSTDTPRDSHPKQGPHEQNVAVVQSVYGTWVRRLPRALENTGAQLIEATLERHAGAEEGPPWFVTEVTIKVQRPDPLWVLQAAARQ